MEPAQPVQIFETKDKSKSELTRDGFANFAAKLGVTSQKVGPGAADNLLSHGHYQFNLVTRNRIALEAAYRGSWIVGRVIDTKAKDMVRAGIEITTNEDPETVEDIKAELNHKKVWTSTCSTLKWGDLYGGAIAVMQIDGQDLKSPLDPDTVGEGQFLGLITYDRWQVYPALDHLINSGPDMGLPEYYDIVLGANLNDPGMEPGGQTTEQANGRVRVHHSRCLRKIGVELPFWQAITEMMWGESVLERMWDRLIAFDDATMSTGNLISRAQLRTVGIESLREILAAGGAAQDALIAQFEYMRQFQNNEGISLLDKNDTFASTAYSFAGLSDVMLQFAQQVSGSAEIPLIILFNQSPSGLNSTGDSDIRTYYDAIKSKQEAELRPFFEVLLKIVWRSKTGEAPPSDLAFTFVPLWQMSATDKATVAKTNTDTIIEAHEAGAIDNATMMKELKQDSAETGLFTHITDEAIEEAENEEPPEPGTPGVGETGNTTQPGSEASAISPPIVEGKPEMKKPTGDSAWKKIKRFLSRDDQERKPNGEFGSGGSGGGGGGSSKAPSEEHAELKKKWAKYKPKFSASSTAQLKKSAANDPQGSAAKEVQYREAKKKLRSIEHSHPHLMGDAAVSDAKKIQDWLAQQ